MSDFPRPRRRVVSAPERRLRPELQAVRVIVATDDDPDAAYLGQEAMAERRAAYERGEFGFLAVRVEADVTIEGTAQTLVSPGQGSVESDAGEQELERIADEEWRALRDVLKAVGVSTAQLPLAVQAEWVEWRT